MLVVRAAEADLATALLESAGLLATVEDREVPAAGAWVLPDGPTVLLGRMQHAGRVLADVAPPGWAVL